MAYNKDKMQQRFGSVNRSSRISDIFKDFCGASRIFHDYLRFLIFSQFSAVNHGVFQDPPPSGCLVLAT